MNLFNSGVAVNSESIVLASVPAPVNKYVNCSLKVNGLVSNLVPLKNLFYTE